MNKIVTNTLDCYKGQFSKKYLSKKTSTTVNALQLQKRLMHEKKRESKTYKRLEKIGEILWYLKKNQDCWWSIIASLVSLEESVDAKMTMTMVMVLKENLFFRIIDCDIKMGSCQVNRCLSYITQTESGVFAGKLTDLIWIFI